MLLIFSFQLATENEDNRFCDYEPVNFKYRWKAERKAETLNLLQQDTFSDQLMTLNSDISSCTSSNEVETCVTDFVRFIDTVAAPLFKKRVGLDILFGIFLKLFFHNLNLDFFSGVLLSK